MAGTFSNYFVNVVEDIGKNYVFDPQNHPSLKKIEGFNLKNAFDFKPTDESSVSKINDKFNLKKATDEDKISTILLKLDKPSLVNPIINLINKTIRANSFLSKLKKTLKFHLNTRKTTQC